MPTHQPPSSNCDGALTTVEHGDTASQHRLDGAVEQSAARSRHHAMNRATIADIRTWVKRRVSPSRAIGAGAVLSSLVRLTSRDPARVFLGQTAPPRPAFTMAWNSSCRSSSSSRPPFSGRVFFAARRRPEWVWISPARSPRRSVFSRAAFRFYVVISHLRRCVRHVGAII